MNITSTNENQESLLGEDENGNDALTSFTIQTVEQAKQADAYMKNLFEDEYDRVKEIFYRICTSRDFRYKILVTRRAYLLYKIFASIFSLFPEARPEIEEEYVIRGEICNSHSLDSIDKSEIKEQDRFLIFDDIIVHGRAIKNTVKKVMEKNVVLKNISVWCLFEKENANCLPNDIKERVTVYKICNEEVWKTHSDNVTDVVIRYGSGYTSYIDTYILSGVKQGKTKRTIKGLLNIFNHKDNYQILEISSLEKFDIKGFTVFDTEKYANSKLHEVGCVRLYKYNDCILGIPYLFIGAVKESDVFPYALQLLKKYEVKQIPSIFFIDNNPNTELSTLFLKWTVNTIGKKLVEQILDIADLSIQKTIRRKETFYRLDNSSLISVPNSDVPITFCDEADNPDIKFCLNSLFDSFKENGRLTVSENKIKREDLTELMRGAFIIYAYKIKEEDEKRSQTSQDRYIGIRLTDMLNACYAFLKTISVDSDIIKQQIEIEVMSLFIQAWDCGMSAYDFATFKDHNNTIVAGFIKNGEQVFRSLYEYFKDAYQYYYAYSARTLITDINKLIIYGSYLEKELPDNMREKIRLFNKYMEMNSSYYADVYVVDPPKKSKDSFEVADKYLFSKN